MSGPGRGIGRCEWDRRVGDGGYKWRTVTLRGSVIEIKAHIVEPSPLSLLQCCSIPLAHPT